ncbi:hypothetical protein A2757_02605 [Candidatus Giovannonibacteria bacterium RIFCSPHIGHO2_01_FULL_48_47]|nr:MAG: hypothetical protein A2757_02605 [Candidatus Giovannonibacteria bacterium RIFCSPHIGHO2_01_FULL_48_47]OGF67888.1 MAG: hypothetical protein A3D61_02215 [Candidatus Giovannonibacteria bacterium RIFCSPHIGHO2_02_FULL_48_15]OGF88702.1 MAG: hypothetical protein A3B26_00750 [Candidatus Giovannonibacteria bacterium RIFCSPLOWO2_01_FULL_48_47]OGF95030.1 MAG: hypothetical protein A2433_02520 [Candidatus Giovannonibacteria bacterium RIFOXYC1_FULL_48_8]OGF96012.1 MAG: hypothetical protein A2613_00365
MIAQIALSVIFFVSLLIFRFPGPAPSLPPAAALSFRSLGAAEQKIPSETGLGDLGLEAESVYILDLTENKTLYEKNALEVRPLASLTKLMTALLLEEKVPAGFFIPVSREAIRQEGDDGFRAGEKFRKEDLIDIILVASSNDAAYAAAEFVGAGLEGGEEASVSRFVALMNERARELGLLKTSFLNANGLDTEINFKKIPGANGTAFEIARLLEFIFKNQPELIERARSEEFEIVSDQGRRLKAKNTNQALADIPQLIAAKTGFTDLAGGNLVFIFDAGFSRPVLVSILGSSEEGRFLDAKKIVNAVLAYYAL